MENLVQLIRQNPHFCEARRDLDGVNHCVQIEGMAVAAKGFFVSALARERQSILLITYNYEQAERLYEDISALTLDTDDILLVPPADGMIYQDGSTDADITSKRIAALIHLMDARPGIVVAPIAAVLQRTVSPAVLAAHRLNIKSSNELDLDKCAHTLVEMGYECADMTGRPGEFSRRGGILDVFPSNADSPVRIELFGDEIESIRHFSVETQRSAGHLQSVDIAPAREMLFDTVAAKKASDALTLLLSSEVNRLEQESGRDVAAKLQNRAGEHISNIGDRTAFNGMEYYLPAVCPEEASLLDYLPAHTVVVLDEPHQIKSHWDQLHEELLESMHARIGKGDVLGIPVDHVISFDDAAHKLKRRHQKLLLSLLPRPITWLTVDKTIVMSASPMESFGSQTEMFIEQLKMWMTHAANVVLVSSQSHRVIELMTEHEIAVSPLSDLVPGKAGIFVVDGSLRSGFKLIDANLMVVTDSEMFGSHRVRKRRKTFKQGLAITSLLEIQEGDFVVHISHGIGCYRGLKRLSGSGGDKDYLIVEYSGTDKLYVPMDQMDRIQKYIGADGVRPTLNKLGNTEWAKTTKKVKQSVREMAKDLIELYASRQAMEGYSYSPDTPWQQEMESAFPYEETPDQMEAIQDVKHDLESPKPMDRLICGDVGYGKTEVAMRAVFKVVNDGKQVAVLTPTTVLTQQHFNTFTERFAAYPVRVEMLSRFKSRAEQKKVIEGLRTGEVDVVIGTHRLLSKDIEFRDLGLLVVDEEQRFGVAHKERLKKLRKTVDALTLSATPIPRTLHMSLSGIRDMSLINDPPEGRSPVRTVCREYEDELVRDAILRELDRDGQVYFVHNRVDNIEHMADHIRNLVPYARVAVGHGQMNEDELEQVMVDLYEDKTDVLVCTTIIESGLDIPNINTIIINNADKMGLSQLYQLRGRVGRSNRQAYAYLLYEPFRVMSEIAEKRLQAIKEFTGLGSGFKIALRDLEIRGTGNLLGPEQHGQMASVGFDLYCQLLSEAIQELKGDAVEHFDLPPADLPMDAYIPSSYIPMESERLSLYKKMTAVREDKDVDKLEEEIKDRFGKPPKPVVNSLGILRLRIKAAHSGIAAITSDNQQISMKFGAGIRLASEVSRDLRKKYQGCVFAADKVAVDPRTPRVIKMLGYILDDLPAALEESKNLYMALLQ